MRSGVVHPHAQLEQQWPLNITPKPLSVLLCLTAVVYNALKHIQISTSATKIKTIMYPTSCLRLEQSCISLCFAGNTTTRQREQIKKVWCTIYPMLGNNYKKVLLERFVTQVTFVTLLIQMDPADVYLEASLGLVLQATQIALVTVYSFCVTFQVIQ